MICVLYFCYTRSSVLYTLSLHDALPIYSFYVRVFQNDFESCFYTFCICSSSYVKEVCRLKSSMFDKIHRCHSKTSSVYHTTYVRSEEHTSELQSRENLVCRLLLEKINK